MKSPLKPKRTDFSFKSGVFDYKAIREKAAENPFGIKGNPPAKPRVPCANAGCSSFFDPETNEWSSGCSGACQY